MKQIRKITTAFVLLTGLVLGGCSLIADTDDLELSQLPNLENTTGDAGGTGGETPPPGD